ncbi:hypothetical protein L7F22_062659 [Adiantum nelumboides]|nr:hypothetical protein [Adiantum nelumboides]
MLGTNCLIASIDAVKLIVNRLTQQIQFTLQTFLSFFSKSLAKMPISSSGGGLIDVTYKDLIFFLSHPKNIAKLKDILSGNHECSLSANSGQHSNAKASSVIVKLISNLSLKENKVEEEFHLDEECLHRTKKYDLKGLAIMLGMKDYTDVFEERILNSRVELTLGKLLDIAKPEFYAKFSDMIKRKRQIQVEAESENPSKAQHTETTVGRWFGELDEDELGTMVESNIKQVHFNDEAEEFISSSYFSRAHWARATITKTVVRIGYFDEPMIALVDSGFEINIMSKCLYVKGNWPIDIEYGWRFVWSMSKC